MGLFNNRTNREDNIIETDRLNNLGVEEFRIGNIDGAIGYYVKALEVFPTNDDSLINLAICLIKKGLFEQSRKFSKRAVLIDSTRAEAYRTVGDSYYSQGDREETIKWYKEASKRGDKSCQQYLLDQGEITWLEISQYPHMKGDD